MSIDNDVLILQQALIEVQDSRSHAVSLNQQTTRRLVARLQQLQDVLAECDEGIGQLSTQETPWSKLRAKIKTALEQDPSVPWPV